MIDLHRENNDGTIRSFFPSLNIIFSLIILNNSNLSSFIVLLCIHSLHILHDKV